MKPPARAIAEHLVWGTDGGVWAVWRLDAEPVAHQALAKQVDTHAKIRSMLVGLPAESMLLSVCERLDPWDVVSEMIDGVDLDAQPCWAEVGRATATQIADAGELFRRRFYVSALVVEDGSAGVWDRMRQAAGPWGTGPVPLRSDQITGALKAARTVAARISGRLVLSPASTGEIWASPF